MRKRFGIAVAFIMVIVLCLALTGCGQNTSKPATSNNDVVQPDVSGGENHEENTTSTGIDNKNPQQDVNGLWVFEVRGHEVKLRTNIWDYIGTDETANFFRLTSLARNLGYTERYNYDGLHMNKRSDGTLVFVGFQEHDLGASTEIMVGTETGIWSSVRYQNYDTSKMEYVYENNHFPVSFEFIVLCTYALEYNQDGAHDDTFSTILADYPGYVLPSPE